MQIDKKYRLEKAVCTDETRTNLTNISITRRHAIACDGRMIAIVPVEVDEGDEAGWLSPDALKLARKVNPKGLDTIRIVLNGTQELPDGSTIKRPSFDDVHPPKMLQILLHAHRGRTFRIGSMLPCSNHSPKPSVLKRVVLEFGSPTETILVRPVHHEDGVCGVLMPVRLNNKERN
jgi:hypothetical protein